MLTGKKGSSLKLLLFALVGTTLVYWLSSSQYPDVTSPLDERPEWTKMWEKFDKRKIYYIPDYKYSDGDEEPQVHTGPIKWEDLPISVQMDMTLGGKIECRPEFWNTEGDSPQWNYQAIEEWINIDSDNKTCHSGYEGACQCYIRAFKEFPVKDKSVVILGSSTPWVEAIALAHGAAVVTTTDFNVPVITGNKTIPLELKGFDQLKDLYDVVFSYSSLEHDGLGRYRDPINPFGDFLRMKAVKNLLKNNGLMFLSVPIGKDALVFNAHRIYGEIRFPLLIEGYKFLSFFPDKPTTWNQNLQFNQWDGHNQPVVVLQNIP